MKRTTGLLGPLGAIALFALPAAAQSPVSVENAPYHRVVFANEDLAVLDNRYPAGSDSGFHLHPRELFYVIIAPAKASSQRPGQPLRELPATKVGTIGMNPVSAEPFVHRVVNQDSKRFDVVAVEIRRPKPSGAPVNVRAPESGFVQVMDNARVRAWRAIVAPGQSLPVLKVGSGVRIVVRGGLLGIAKSGLPDQPMALDAGNFEQLVPGQTLGLRNIGSTTVELVDVELK